MKPWTASPRVSVVMPVFNERSTIDEIIGRVLALPLTIELIVVDDCSTDGTGQRLQELQRERGFVLLNQPANGGRGARPPAGVERVPRPRPILQRPDLHVSPHD